VRWVLVLAGAAFSETTERMVSACKGVVEATQLGDKTIKLPQDFDTGLCWGAFAALQYAINIYTQEMMFGVCAPEKSTRSQLIAIFVEYAKKHPERYHEDSFLVAINALHDVFPCQTGGKLVVH